MAREPSNSECVLTQQSLCDAKQGHTATHTCRKLRRDQCTHTHARAHTHRIRPTNRRPLPPPTHARSHDWQGHTVARTCGKLKRAEGTHTHTTRTAPTETRTHARKRTHILDGDRLAMRRGYPIPDAFAEPIVKLGLTHPRTQAVCIGAKYASARNESGSVRQQTECVCVHVHIVGPERVGRARAAKRENAKVRREQTHPAQHASA